MKRHRHTPEQAVKKKVQDVLSAKYLVGEKQREHPHYLKGSIHCGTCGARLIVNYAKGRRGGISLLPLHRPPEGQAQLQPAGPTD